MLATVPMMTLNLTICDGQRAVRLRARLAGPLPWERIRSAVCQAAGLPAETVLFHGVGAVEKGWLMGTPPLLTGCILSTTPAAHHAVHSPLVLAVIGGPDGGRSVALDGRPISISRDPSAGLSLTDTMASRRHAIVTPAATGVIVRDLASTNGVVVDGRPVGSEGGLAATGSMIRIGSTLLQIQLTTEPPGGFQPDGFGHAIRAGRPPSVPQAPVPLPKRPVAPEKPGRRTLPLLSALTGAILGGVLALVLANPMYLAFAAFGPVMMIGNALSDRLHGRRSYRRLRVDHQTAVAAWSKAMAVACDVRRRAAWRQWPGPVELARRAESASARLWDLRRGDADYLTASIGFGDRPADDPRDGAADAAGLAECEPGSVSDTPIVLPLRGTIGLIGPTGRGLARYLITQIACRHSPAEVQLIIVSDQSDLEACRDLPHIVDSGLQRPGPTAREASESTMATAQPERDIVILLDGPAAWSSRTGQALLAQAASSAGPAARGWAGGGRLVDGQAAGNRHVSAVVLAHSAGQLPPQAVQMATGSGSLAQPAAAPAADQIAAIAPSTGTRTTQVSPDLLARVCRALAPLRDGPADGRVISADLPEDVTLTDLTGPLDAARLRRLWSVGPAQTGSGAAPGTGPGLGSTIGIGAQGPVTFDMDRDGPHLLIAGTTGSGKSELLQTLISSSAAASPPDQLTLLLVDYKGGSAFGSVSNLPHVVGMLTDLDPDRSARALTSLRAELHRRERLEADGLPPAAKLVLVIDEFATLAAELPSFLAGVLDIAQRGRSLGLHLILATQRPAGVVTPAIRANISARICLRVTDPADSLDVIGIPDAAALPMDRPGRAILRAGGRTVTFQTARVTVPPPPEFVITRAGGGQATTSGPRSADTPTAADAPTTIVAQVIGAACEASADRPPPVRPWLAPLPDRITPSASDPAVFAVADLPAEQRRCDLDAPAGSVLILGPPGSGRSTALRRVATIAADRNDEILVVDGGGALADLAAWSTVSTYLTTTEPRLVLRLISLLADRSRQPRDGRRRHLIVDHYDIVAAELERADYVAGGSALAELQSRSGESLLISAAGPTRLALQRAAATFPEVIELGSSIAQAPAGRGRWRGREIQIVDAQPLSAGRGRTASAAPTSQSAPPGPALRGLAPSGPALRGLAPSGPAPSGPTPALRQPWPDRLIVRELPKVVHAAELPASDPTHVMVGVGGDAADPFSVDLAAPSGAIVVAGPRRSGVATAVRMLAANAASAGMRVIRANLASPVESRPPVGIVDIDCRDDGAPLRAALAAHEGPLLLIADHDGIGDEHPAAEVLARFLAVCGAGQHLLIGVRTDALTRTRRGHLREALGYRRGLLLAPDQADGPLLDISVPKRIGPMVPGRGLWASGGEVVPVQVALPTGRAGA